MIDGLASMYTKLRDAGFPTVIMGDNRSPGQAIPVCLQNNASDPSKCTFTMEEVGQVGGFPLQSAAVAKVVNEHKRKRTSAPLFMTAECGCC